jgi:hypothetical protein
MCHQAAGQGAPPIFPPLAGSDWLLADRARAIKVLCEGLSGSITVNGQKYSGAMPAQVLDDQAVADVLTFVTNSWGNMERPFTSEEVRAARAQSRFPTYEALVKATTFRPLPAAPAGWKVREIVQLPEFCTRLASDGKGENVYVLQQNGAVHLLTLATATMVQIISPEDYMDPQQRDAVALGCTVDTEGRLLVVTNWHNRDARPLALAEITIWRSSETVEGRAAKLLPWVKTSYPQGNRRLQPRRQPHRLRSRWNALPQQGSRTDGGEPGTDRTISGWRGGGNRLPLAIDPKAEQPKIEVLAREFAMRMLCGDGREISSR